MNESGVADQMARSIHEAEAKIAHRTREDAIERHEKYEREREDRALQRMMREHALKIRLTMLSTIVWVSVVIGIGLVAWAMISNVDMCRNLVDKHLEQCMNAAGSQPDTINACTEQSLSLYQECRSQ